MNQPSGPEPNDDNELEHDNNEEQHFKCQKGKAPKCKTCKNGIKVEQLHVLVKGKYIPEGQHFATKCLTVKPNLRACHRKKF